MTTLVYTHFILSKSLCKCDWFLIYFSRNGSNSTKSKLGFPFSNSQTVFVPTYFACFEVFEFLRPLIAWPISEAATSNKSAPIFFEAGTIFFLKKGDCSYFKGLQFHIS